MKKNFKSLSLLEKVLTIILGTFMLPALIFRLIIAQLMNYFENCADFLFGEDGMERDHIDEDTMWEYKETIIEK